MSQNTPYEPEDATSARERTSQDVVNDNHATGLAGIPTADVAADTSERGVAGSSTFDPRVSPAHEGLAGSPSDRGDEDEPS